MRLEQSALLAIEWFKNNDLKLNKDQCHLLISGNKYGNLWVKMGKENIWRNANQRLLEMGIEKHLNFNDYIPSLCKKAGRNLAV